jgi:hypothetical protein
MCFVAAGAFSALTQALSNTRWRFCVSPSGDAHKGGVRCKVNLLKQMHQADERSIPHRLFYWSIPISAIRGAFCSRLAISPFLP